MEAIFEWNKVINKWVLLAEANSGTFKVFQWYEDPEPTPLTHEPKPYRIYGKKEEGVHPLLI